MLPQNFKASFKTSNSKFYAIDVVHIPLTLSGIVASARCGPTFRPHSQTERSRKTLGASPRAQSPLDPTLRHHSHIRPRTRNT